jgi:uncharacterized repeat protein (TIGR01451 family)
MTFQEQGAVMKKLIEVILMTTLFSVSANAQEQNHLDVNTVVQKQEVTVNDEGESEIRLVSVGTVTPGERVVYTITFRNIGGEPAEEVVITNPIAESLTYLDGSAFGPGAAIEFSIDGGTAFANASDLTVTENDAIRAATAEDFTHVRWLMKSDLAAGAQGVARFTAVLN